ncbi:fimbrial protein [Hafnia paralvei]|uniref:fimbrial protein n=1 Tax=Hafnia paralvei TaxID=546367 RepID=UPI0026716BC9|nr:fimbrial protein [Hafnia paralvei]
MSFKKTTFCLALSLAGLASASVMAADGTVNFKGKISDAPCSVSIPSSNQVVDLGTVPAADLNASGLKSTAKNFQIDLLNCSAAAKSVTVTFGGSSPTGKDALFSISSPDGTAAGTVATNVGIEVADSKGVDIKPNVASSSITLTPSIASQSLYFTANYQAYGVATTGDANATSDFTLTYQ